MISLKYFNGLCTYLSAVLLLVIFGCHPLAPKHDMIPEGSSQNYVSQQEFRTLASRKLTDQAQLSIESGNPDDAFRLLERAISLDPQSGENYYWLAEAWIAKGNSAQAREYYRLAVIYLEESSVWSDRLSGQKERIENVAE